MVVRRTEGMKRVGAGEAEEGESGVEDENPEETGDSPPGLTDNDIPSVDFIFLTK